METFSDLRWDKEKGKDKFTTSSSLRENKDSRINRLNITEEEKETLKRFFRQHPEKESAIDWNRKDLTYDDFKGLLDTASKSEVKRQIRAGKTSGLSLLVEGRDYEIADQQGASTLYKILNYEAMCIIASNDVAPALFVAVPTWARRPENEWYQYYNAHKEEMDRVAIRDGVITDTYGKYTPYAPNAHWCVAMKNTKSFWSDYHEDRGLNFYVHCDTSRTDEFGKICLYRENEETSAWSARDEEFSLISLLNSSVLSEDSKAIVEDYEFEVPKESEELQHALEEFYRINFKLEYWKRYELENIYGDHLLSFEMDGDEDPFSGYVQQISFYLDGFNDEIDEDTWDDMTESLKHKDVFWDCSFDGEEAYVELRVKPFNKKEEILEALVKIDKLFKGVISIISQEGYHPSKLNITTFFKKYFKMDWSGNQGITRIGNHRVRFNKRSNDSLTVKIFDLSEDEGRQAEEEGSYISNTIRNLNYDTPNYSVKAEFDGIAIRLEVSFRPDANNSDLEDLAREIRFCVGRLTPIQA